MVLVCYFVIANFGRSLDYYITEKNLLQTYGSQTSMRNKSGPVK